MGVHNVPSSYKTMINCLKRTSETARIGQYSFFCPVCNILNPTNEQCQNSECSQHQKFQEPILNTFFEFDIFQQIDQILSREKCLTFPDHKLPSQQSPVTDITNSSYYQKIMAEEKTKFITLTMNVDGIGIENKNETGIWVIMFIINEIKKKYRFKMNNAVFGGVWANKKKPKREH
ncbi:unnamed protein product, partial [Didymodactylos carnosus]